MVFFFLPLNQYTTFNAAVYELKIALNDGEHFDANLLASKQFSKEDAFS